MDPVTIWPLEDGIGYVSLIRTLGDDLTVVNAARVSYAKQSVQMTLKEEKLITYLMDNKHGTPFEHVVYQFRVRAPLFVVHQWERHRMASYNEESGRYIELRPDYYTPKGDHHEVYEDAYRDCNAIYHQLLEAGEPKERARMVLPSGLYKEFWWTVNARSLMNFLSLRNDSHAQAEIRAYAVALEHIFAQRTPKIQAAFAKNGRIAP
jgi:thymidylate synthase (FAD)